MKKSKPQPGMRIGMLSRLSGVPTGTIRIWERRYEALVPQRTPAGGRLYTKADAERLVLLKQLVDRGHSIGIVAGLSEGKLRQLVAEAGESLLPQNDCRVAAVGGLLVERLAEAAKAVSRVQWLGGFDSLERLVRGTASGVDVVVMEVAALGPAQVVPIQEFLRKARIQLMVVVYAFAAERDLVQLDHQHLLLLRAPVDPQRLLRLCLLGVGAGARAQAVDSMDMNRYIERPVPARLFSDAELAQFSTGPTTVRCECPRHLSDLIAGLEAFERYSAQCENLNPQDAVLHRTLASVSGHARALVEEGLRRVIDFEERMVARRVG